MPVTSTTTKNQILNAWLGPNRGTGTPASYDVELWQDDPRGASPAEADWGGYAAVPWSSDDWLTADAAEVDSDGVVDFGAPSSAGTDAARFWALRDTTTGELAYSAPLERPISVAAATVNSVQIRMTVPYASN